MYSDNKINKITTIKITAAKDKKKLVHIKMF